MVWLWKDHTSYYEAQRITEAASKTRPEYLSRIGGIYSSEWYWSKIWHCSNEDPEVFNAAYSFVEICDWIPAILTGESNPDLIKRSICAAGHKAMFSNKWGGFPETVFLESLSPGLGKLRGHLANKAYSAEERAGYLSAGWAEKLGLSTNVSVAVGAFDAHMGAVGAGIKKGTLVKILGTSTCDIMISPNNKTLSDIPGVCGIVDGSVMNGYYGIEAGNVKGRGELFLRFDSLTLPNGVTRDFRARIGTMDGRASEDFDRAEGKIKSEGNKSGDARTVGEAAAAGASIGVIAGAATGHYGMEPASELLRALPRDSWACCSRAGRMPFWPREVADMQPPRHIGRRNDDAEWLGVRTSRLEGAGIRHWA